ncbi:peptide chain release factor N(5)-glutamine methyltransferase [Chloroflexota bacterium]
MTIKQLLSHATEILASAEIDDSSLESELLLRHIIKIDRVQLYLSFDCELTTGQSEEFWNLVQRRLNREPTAYIIGHREFYGLDFIVNSSVLIPRPESELLVEKAIELAQHLNPSTIADIGTGCGAIAVSLALNLPRAKIYATDISTSALNVASSNCQKHGVINRIRLLEGDLLNPLPEPVDLIVANLPYVREPELATVNTLNFEPPLALNGGTDGLEKISGLCARVAEKLRPGGSLLLEVGRGQGKVVSSLLSNRFPSAGIELVPDLSGIDRVVSLSFDLQTGGSQLDSRQVC